jgi:hypothetical protein
MFHVPAHKQTDPAKLPAQRVNPIDQATDFGPTAEFLATKKAKFAAERAEYAKRFAPLDPLAIG